jgi:RNA 2',3'-cyclic 3'-phosphodiesterase
MDDSHIRLFVALPVPERCARLLAGLPRAGLDGKWSVAGDLHVTLRFLGDLPPESVPDIKSALARVRRPPFGIEVSGLGFFDNKRGAVLYARVDSTRKMNALCGDVTDALTPLGFDFGLRPFVPHITLARLKNARNVIQYIEKQEENVKTGWQAGAFHLMQSAAPDGADLRYSTLAEYPLV